VRDYIKTISPVKIFFSTTVSRSIARILTPTDKTEHLTSLDFVREHASRNSLKSLYEKIYQEYYSRDLFC
jgi:hypothetical protein